MKNWSVSFVLHTPDDWEPPEPYAMQMAVMQALGFTVSVQSVDDFSRADSISATSEWGISGAQIASRQGSSPAPHDPSQDGGAGH